jgi:hypothetical protein
LPPGLPSFREPIDPVDGRWPEITDPPSRGERADMQQ